MVHVDIARHAGKFVTRAVGGPTHVVLAWSLDLTPKPRPRRPAVFPPQPKHLYQMYLLVALQLASSCCLLVGYYSNVSAAVTWVLEASLTHFGTQVDATDCLACVANNQLLHLIVLPCGAVWSVDAVLLLRHPLPRSAQDSTMLLPLLRPLLRCRRRQNMTT